MKRLALLISILLFVLFIGCDKKLTDEDNQESSPKTNDNSDSEDMETDEDKDKDKDYDDFVEGMKNLKEMMKGGKDVKVIDSKKLKEFLPEEIEGMKRTNTTNENTNAFGINISQTEAQFKSEEGNQDITISITDMGSMKGLAGLAAFAWAYADVDKETETGYERTTKYSGYKAFEKYNTESNSGSIEVLVGKRFTVKAEGYNVPVGKIQSAIEEVNLDDLESKKNEGIKEE
jgi:hypothetical protein